MKVKGRECKSERRRGLIGADTGKEVGGMQAADGKIMMECVTDGDPG